jgi:tRNA/rRNA methyltransferase
VTFAGTREDHPAMTSPVIILVRPQLGENIGMVARAMWNFGLRELRLVSPRDGWPNPAAGPPAAGADVVLDEAQVFDTVKTALADCALVYATTIRTRDMLKDVVTARRMVEDVTPVLARGQKVGLMFGPERSGLETDDVALAHKILTVPVNPAFGSLNLSQAVILCAYEWFQSQTDTPQQQLQGDYEGPATHEALEGLIAHVESELSQGDYYFPEHRADAMRRTLRGILTRPQFTAQEVRTLRGVVKALAGKTRG